MSVHGLHIGLDVSVIYDEVLFHVLDNLPGSFKALFADEAITRNQGFRAPPSGVIMHLPVIIWQNSKT